jgi:hypothetical protein
MCTENQTLFKFINFQDAQLKFSRHPVNRPIYKFGESRPWTHMSTTPKARTGGKETGEAAQGVEREGTGHAKEAKTQAGWVTCPSNTVRCRQTSRDAVSSRDRGVASSLVQINPQHHQRVVKQRRPAINHQQKNQPKEQQVSSRKEAGVEITKERRASSVVQ